MQFYKYVKPEKEKLVKQKIRKAIYKVLIKKLFYIFYKKNLIYV